MRLTFVFWGLCVIWWHTWTNWIVFARTPDSGQTFNTITGWPKPFSPNLQPGRHVCVKRKQGMLTKFPSRGKFSVRYLSFGRTITQPTPTLRLLTCSPFRHPWAFSEGIIVGVAVMIFCEFSRYKVAQWNLKWYRFSVKKRHYWEIISFYTSVTHLLFG